VKRKLLCSFHFFERLPDVSSQYSQIGKQTTFEPLAKAHQRFPLIGSVNVHGVLSLVTGFITSKMYGELQNKIVLLPRLTT
jgi:hypothetical protein